MGVGAFKGVRRGLIALAALCAGVLPAAAPVNDAWHADPEAQFLLDVNLHRLTIGDGVRAYQTPEGACVVLGDFLTTLDVPMKIDLETSKASGWAFEEKNSISIDRRALVAEVKGKRESFAITDVREVPEGWCIDQKALGRWFGMQVKADVFNSLLRLDTDRKLPVEMAIERRNRGEALALKRKAALNLETLPMVRVPYRMWRTPALEFIVSGGARYSANGGSVALSRGATVNAAGELAAVSYAASAELNGRGLPTNVWARFYRSDPEGKLLGPLHATHVAAGDVPGLGSSFRDAGPSGRGAVVTNRPLTHSGSFDRTEFRGRLPEGWDAELYRNGTLVAFDNGRDHQGEYVFSNVDVLSGDNEFEVILHGPQGQVQRITDNLNVGQDNAPPGKLWYWAGVRQPGTELLSLAKSANKPPGNKQATSAPEAIVQAQYGIDRRMSVSALVRSALVEDERVTFVEGSVRRSIGPALVDIGVATDNKHRMAARAQVMAKIGSVSVSASSILTNGTQAADTNGYVSKAVHRVAIGAPIKIGHTKVPVSLSAGRTDFVDGGKAYDGTLTLGARIGRFNLANSTSYRKVEPGPGALGPPLEELTNELIGTGNIGRVRLRGSVLTEVLPEKRLRRLDLDAYFARDEESEWDAGVSYDNLAHLATARIGHIRRFDSVAVAVTGEAQSNGSVGAHIRLSFALDPSQRGFHLTRERLASTGLVRARIFEDVNENGRFDSGEPLEKEAAITTGIKQSDEVTDAKGEVTVFGLSPYVPVAIGVDQSSLSNPALTALRPAQVVVPRPGVGAMVDIALVGGGSIEGYAAKADGQPYEGLDFDLLDASGQVVGSARTDLDGYFVFENIHYGTFALKLSPASAAAIKAAPFAPVEVRINRDRPAARIGAVTVAALN